MINALNTTIQFAFCDLSIKRFANDGIETFGSFVQCTKSERKDTILSPLYTVENH